MSFSLKDAKWYFGKKIICKYIYVHVEMEKKKKMHEKNIFSCLNTIY